MPTAVRNTCGQVNLGKAVIARLTSNIAAKPTAKPNNVLSSAGVDAIERPSSHQAVTRTAQNPRHTITVGVRKFSDQMHSATKGATTYNSTARTE